jgi:two-component system, chemotaxis family, chemotaxis protein CheY
MSKALRFLVVDDFPTMRRIIKNLLLELGYIHVMEADDGHTALPILQQGDIDFLIADWHMPVMPGLELLKAVRADARLAKLPVLMLAPAPGHTHIDRARKAGASGYVVKPFTALTLKAKLDAILHGGRSSGG